MSKEGLTLSNSQVAFFTAGHTSPIHANNASCMPMCMYATVGHISPALFDALLQKKFNPQEELANTMRTFATASHTSRVLFDACTRPPNTPVTSAPDIYIMEAQVLAQLLAQGSRAPPQLLRRVITHERPPWP
eukprot:1714412-Karenia_brevis.AAC.1